MSLLFVGSRKVYVRIPCGEIQYGRVSHRVTVWFRGRRLELLGSGAHGQVPEACPHVPAPGLRATPTPSGASPEGNDGDAGAVV